MDATTSDVQQNDASTDASSDVALDGTGCPTAISAYTGSNPACQAMVAECNSCGSNRWLPIACVTASFSAFCNDVSNVFSAAVTNVTAACATTCDEDAAIACEVQKLADASLTSAQAKAASDYCSTCFDSGAACIKGVQELLIGFSDTIATEIDLCTPDASSACGTFNSCANAVFATIPCADAGLLTMGGAGFF